MRRVFRIIERSLTRAKDDLHAHIKIKCLPHLGPYELTLTNVEGRVVGCIDARCVGERCDANGGDDLK